MDTRRGKGTLRARNDRRPGAIVRQSGPQAPDRVCLRQCDQRLKSIEHSEMLPDDIRVLVQQVLELYETASNPFLGMNLSDQKQRQPNKLRVDIEVEDAEAQTHQDWSNDD